MKVLILSGSIGMRSCTRTLLLYIDTILKEHAIETVWWDLGEHPLPIALPEYHQNQKNHPDRTAREFAAAVEHADGFVLGSPLYHDSFSGVLKNALDILPEKAFSYKPVGLVSHSSNIRSCVTPCNQLRPVVRSLAGYATQLQIGTTDADYKEKDNQLMLVNEDVKKRVEALVKEIVLLSQAMNVTSQELNR